MSTYSEDNLDNIEEVALPDEINKVDDTFGLPESISEESSYNYSEPLPKKTKPSLGIFEFTRNTVIGIIGAIGIILVFGLAVLCDRKGSNPRLLFADMINPADSATTTYSRPTPSTTEATAEATTTTTASEETTTAVTETSETSETSETTKKPTPTPKPKKKKKTATKAPTKKPAKKPTKKVTKKTAPKP